MSGQPAAHDPRAAAGPLVIERSRTLLRVHGRDPVRMIHGLATADITAITPDRGAYTAFLTPKGKMIADARVFASGDDAAPQLLIDTAPDAADALREHFRRSIPPLFARAEDVSDRWAVIGVYGEGAGAVVGRVLGAEELEADVEERVVRAAGAGAGADAGGDGAFAVSTYLVGAEGWDLYLPVGAREGVVGALLGAGGRAGDPEVLEALRVAAGRPRWGRELTEDVIPLEAGLLERAISQTKGCYTGQEVIVRILHRGHVNRHLRRLEFAGGAPSPGTELYQPGNERPRGVVTSAVENEAGALGLGYVRREVEPPAELRVGSPEGPPVRVEALD